MATDIRPAGPDDVDAVVELQVALFDEDAGSHDPTVDRSWPREHGRADIEELLRAETATVLVASAEGGVLGFLAGYVAESSATRLTERHAVLRSLYVARDHRRAGAAAGLIERFVSWGEAQGCDEVVVDHYAANEGARRLYASVGFAERSISRAYRIDRR